MTTIQVFLTGDTTSEISGILIDWNTDGVFAYFNMTDEVTFCWKVAVPVSQIRMIRIYEEKDEKED